MGIKPEELVDAATSLRRLLAGFEPDGYSPSECADLAVVLAQAEKACGAARLLASARAVSCGAHRAAGVADPARWVATCAGTTMRQAKDGLSAAAALGSCPSTKEAFLAGELSILQAQEIAKAAAELPGAEGDLLAVARKGDLTRLRDEVRERRLAGTPVGDLHRRQMAARRFRHWRDGLGMVCFEGALPPETGIPLVTRIEREAARMHREAKRAGRGQRFWASAADAFVALTSTAAGTTRGPATDLVIVCDLFAYRRGHAHEGEHCHIVGGGPVPVPLAKAMSEDAFLKAVLHDGREIQRVLHVGRRYTAQLRTALELGPVPSFSGKACVDCGRRGPGLEFDHLDPIANHGVTTYSNVKARCYLCHQDKTERDRLAGRLGRGRRAQARGPAPPDTG